MNKISAFLFGLLSLISCQVRKIPYDLVVDNISMVDVQNSKIITGQTICIHNGKIKKIKKFEPGQNISAAQTIDGKGKFIIPGFWDMHMHLCWKESLNNLFPTLLKYGITGVRDMGGSADLLKNFKQRIKKSPESGPNIFGPGPILDGEKPIHPEFSVALTEKNVMRVLDSLYKEQVDFLKVYSLLPKAVIDSIASFSVAKRIPFAGHVSEYLTPEEASSKGQKSFEHLNRLEDLIGDTNRLIRLSNLARLNSTWLCPTLIIYQRKYEFAKKQFYEHSLYGQLDSDLINEWSQVRQKSEARNLTADEIDEAHHRFEKEKELVKKLFDNNISFLIGTDFAGMQFIYPGYSLHEEMALLQSIGIPPFEILKMACYHPAVFFGISDLYGSIAKGKVADMVILNEDPSQDIRKTVNIDIVIRAGKEVNVNDSHLKSSSR